MGSNMAECHPVAFRWVVQARTREPNPCVVIHADPRFTRTSALADVYAPLRAGTDIVFLGALIRHVADHLQELIDGLRDRERATWTDGERFFHDYLTRYTNAPTLVSADFRDTEDLGGLFSGLSEGKYSPQSWRYHADPPAKRKDTEHSRPESLAERVGRLVGPAPHQDSTLRDSRCVFQVLRRHFRRYTPEMVEEVCGTPRDVFLRVA